RPADRQDPRHRAWVHRPAEGQHPARRGRVALGALDPVDARRLRHDARGCRCEGEVTTTLEATVGDAVKTRRPPWWLLISLLALVAAVFLSVAFGARVVSLSEVWTALTTDSESVTSAAGRSRVPRTILAIVVGAALAVAGVVLQAVTRNPLADPFILGINSGASLLVVIGIAFFGAA